MPTMYKPGYAYGECDICDTPLEERMITQDFWINGELIVIRNVRAGVCPRCGEKVVNAEVGQQLCEMLQHPEYVANAPRLSVPVLLFEEVVAKTVHA
jgi:YgiT-type zinc finger domain-containing protein